MTSLPHSALARRRQLLAGASALLLGGAGRAQSPASLEKVRFTLDWRIDGPGAIVLLTLGKGYFQQEGLDVSVDVGAGSAAAIQRIAGGTHDLGLADTSALVEFLASNPAAPKIQAVYMLMAATPAAVFALAKRGIRRPEDLQGRTLGAPVFDGGRKAFPIFAKANRFDPASVHWTNADPAVRETLLVKGEFDAITGFYYTSLLNLQARGMASSELTVFRYADCGVNLYGNALVASPQLIAQRPTTVAAFVRALNRGIHDVLKDPHAAVAYVKQRDGLVDAAVEERRLRLFLDFIATPAVRQAGLGGVDFARLRANIAQVELAFGLRLPVRAEQLFHPGFLPPVVERRL